MRRMIVCGALALTACHRGPRPPNGVVINEVLSANRAAWVDPDGADCPEYDDYIELYNAGRKAVSLGGYVLSDDVAGPGWTLPNVDLEPGAHLLVVADGDPSQGALHASFSVSRAGETLVLLDAKGKELDRVEVPALQDDRAWGRYGDGGLVWREQESPSPGAANEEPPDDACFDEREDFDDHAVDCLETREGFLALASSRAGLDVVKFDILSFQDPATRHAVFLDSRFFVLHDEWYIFRMLNGQTVEGETMFRPYDGDFPTVAAIYAWAAAVELPTLFPSEFLRWTNDGRLYSPRYYELALGEVRIIGVATLVHIAATDARPERWAFELEASDDATHEEIVAYFHTLEAQLPAEITSDLRWLVRSTAQEAVAQGMEAQGLDYADRLLRYSDLASTGEVDVYGAGTVAGKVHHLRAGEGLESAVDGDILLLDEIPDYLPPGVALLTAVPQTPLAHVALLAESRGIPNVYVAGIGDDPMWDAWARVRAPVAIRATAPDGFEVVPLTPQQYSSWMALSARDPVVVEPVDASAEPYTLDLPATPFADMPRWRPVVGGKSAGMLALVNTPGVITPPDPLGLTIRGYQEHLGTLAWLDAMLAEPAFARPGDARVRYLVLEGSAAYDLRYTTPADVTAKSAFLSAHPTDAVGVLARGGGAVGALTDTPMTPAVRDALVPVVSARFAYLTDAQPLRFRSSSNIEDAEGFNGAGLYASYSGYPVPPSGKRTVEQAILAVWASYWGAEAFEERHAIGIDHRAGDMGVLVEPGFQDDQELANGVITARRLPDGLADRWEVVLNSQPGAISVTNPPADTCAPIEPEVVTVHQADAGAPRITRVTHSTELPDGDVLTDAEVQALFEDTTAVVDGWLGVENALLPAEQRRSTLTLDLEWRLVGAGWPLRDDGTSEGVRVVLKQARTLEPSATRLPADVRSEPFPRDLLARARLVTRTTCTAAEGTVVAVEATTDPQQAPDMGHADDPFTASLVFTAAVDLPELGLAANESVTLTHLELIATHASLEPWSIDAVLDVDAVTRTGLTAITVDDTLSIEAISGAWTGPVLGCTTDVAWASPDTFLADLFEP